MVNPLPLAQGLVLQVTVPFPHPSWLGPRAVPEGPVLRCTSKNPQLRYLTHQHPSLCETQQANITVLLVLSCPSLTSHHLVSCRELLVSCRQDVEVRKLPGCHNLSLAAILLDTLTQTQGELFRELLWSYLLLSVEMTLCIIISISGAAPPSANHGQRGSIPSLSSEPWAPHTDKRGAESSVGLYSHIM